MNTALLQHRDLRGVEELETRRLLAADKLAPDTQTTSESNPFAIVGGRVAEVGQWPWVVSLQRSAEHTCGGTLVRADVVITAAHCVEGETTLGLSAVIGREDLRSDEGEQIGVAQIIIHPDYDGFSYDADIAVLLLEADSTVPPVPYLDSNRLDLTTPRTDATVLGWGSVREAGDLTDILREVHVPIVSNAVANRPISYDGGVTPRMLAAGLAEGGKDSCYGDSGGPLIVQDGAGNHVLAGVVSWGDGCGQPDLYGIYSRVSSFAEWFDSRVQVESAGVVGFTQERFGQGVSAGIVLQDADLGGADFVAVMVRGDRGDRETVVLEAQGKGRFRGSVTLGEPAINLGDDQLNVVGGETIHVEYLDADDGSGTEVSVADSARIIQDDFANQADGASSIGTDAFMNGEIEQSGDVDWFRFDARVDKAYLVRVDLNGTLGDSFLTIYDSDGETVLAFDDDGGRGAGSEVTFAPRAEGTVFIEVAGFLASVGTYRLRVRETEPPEDDHGNGPGRATGIGVPSTVPGNLKLTSDVDWFSFLATEDTLYQIDVTLGTLDDSQLRLFDSDGRSELAFNDDAFGSESRIVWRADTSGPMYFEVSGYLGSVGTYDVSLIEIFDEHANSPRRATQLEVPSLTLGLTGFGDVDWFEFHVTAGNFYEIETSLISLFDTALTLYESDGESVLLTNDDLPNSGASRLIWQATSTTNLFVTVDSFDFFFGEYELSIREILPPRDDFGNNAAHAHAVEVPSTTLGRIQYVTDLDWFAFEAVAGKKYSIETDLRSLSDSVLRLIDADGSTVLAENDDIDPFDTLDLASRMVWTADSDGPRYVEISGFDSDTGTYRLILEVETPGDLNNDGQADAGDIDLLFAAVRNESANPTFDLNMDGSATGEDIDFLIEGILGTRAGDTNLDGKVQFDDFLALSFSFGKNGGWASGDFDGDGLVQFSDFLPLSAHFGFARTPARL